VPNLNGLYSAAVAMQATGTLVDLRPLGRRRRHAARRLPDLPDHDHALSMHVDERAAQADLRDAGQP